MNQSIKSIFKTIESELEVDEYELHHNENSEGFTEFIITPRKVVV